MLPQPNFGHNTPDPEGDEPAGPPKKVGRLRIALWVQTVFAVLAGNMLVFSLMSLRGSDYDQLVDDMMEGASEDSGVTRADAEAAADIYHSSSFLTVVGVLAGLLIISAIISALTAVRLKTRLKVVRRLGIGASIVLLLCAMVAVLVFPGMFLMLMLWVFTSILAVWWLFSGDVKYWMSESSTAAA